MSQVGTMNALYHEFKGKGVEFVLIYKKESHPGQGVPIHASKEEKKKLAARFREEDDVQIPILVDDIHGTAHRLYGELANMLYVVSKTGNIVYRSDWTHPRDLRSFLENLTTAVMEDVSHTKVVYSERLSLNELDPTGSAREKVFQRAGEGAREDYKAGKRKWKDI